MNGTAIIFLTDFFLYFKYLYPSDCINDIKVLMAVTVKRKVTLALTKKLEFLNMPLDQRLVESYFQKQWSRSKFDKCELLFSGWLLVWTVLKDLVSIYKTTRRRGSGNYWIKWKICWLTVLHQDLTSHLTRAFV